MSNLVFFCCSKEKLTGFAGSLDDVAVLPAARLIGGETESHDGQDEDDKEADDGEYVGPSHLALPDVVVVDVVAADTTHVHVVPAGRKDHAPQEHQDACTSISRFISLTKVHASLRSATYVR